MIDPVPLLRYEHINRERRLFDAILDSNGPIITQLDHARGVSDHGMEIAARLREISMAIRVHRNELLSQSQDERRKLVAALKKKKYPR